MNDKKEVKKSILASSLAGSLSGAMVSAVLQPLDVVRTRMQADSAQVAVAVTSTSKTINKIIHEKGVRALWQGTQPTVLRLGVGAGLHFFFLETLKPMFETRSSSDPEIATMSPLGAIMTGGLSRALSAIVSCPITVVKTRMEYTTSSTVGNLGSGGGVPMYKNTFDALHTIARLEGLRGLYRGIVPTILSNTPFSAFYYLFYTRLQTRLQQTDMPTVLVNFSSSTVAAIGATLITQPADVVRTRMQLNLVSSSLSTNTFQIMRNIVISQGMNGLFVGAAPRMIKRTLQTALVWTLYEEIAPRLQAGVATLRLANQ